MQTITELIMQQGLADRLIKYSQLKHLITGSDKRRYGLVNRARKSGELLQLQRGLYVLANRFRSVPCHPFALAQALTPGSYISFETALAYHGWIPERVYTIASVVPGKKSRNYTHERFGAYSFNPLAIQRGFFLELVERIQIEGQSMLIAQPCRALLDIICLRKINWKGLQWLSEGLRIEPSLLNTITGNEMDTLQQVYKHKKVQSFLFALRMELNRD